jgi:hypothetical protein
MLADNPHVLRRLREEVLSVLGPKQIPTFEHVREMKYLRAVINGEASAIFAWTGEWLNNLQKRCDYTPLCKSACSGCCDKVAYWIFRPFNVRCATEEMIWPSATGGQPIYIPKGSS